MMKGRLSAEIFSLPGAQHFLEGLRNDAVQRRSIVALLPCSISCLEVWERLYLSLQARHFSIEPIPLHEISTGRDPISALASFLKVTWPSLDCPHTVANLLRCKNLPDVIFLESFDEIAENDQLAWLGLIRQWAQACQALPDSTSSQSIFSLVSCPSKVVLFHIPEANVRLAVHWWWGVLSAVEVRLLCRLADTKGEALGYWRENLLPAVCGDDLEFAEYLWDHVDLSPNELIHRCLEFGRSRGWENGCLEPLKTTREIQSPSFLNGQNPSFPSATLSLWWAGGVVYCTSEHGVELHTAALAVMEMKAEILHRLWRGQMTLLMPLLDSLRLRFCLHLVRRYGNWPTRWNAAKTDEEQELLKKNPLSCQWSQLSTLFRHCVEVQSERCWLGLVERSCWVRNELAHYRPIRFASFEEIWMQIQRVDF